MSKSITVKIPPWLPEEEAKKIIETIIAGLGGRASIAEVREILGIKPEDLAEDIEVYNIDELRHKEKERLP